MNDYGFYSPDVPLAWVIVFWVVVGLCQFVMCIFCVVGCCHCCETFCAGRQPSVVLVGRKGTRRKDDDDDALAFDRV